ncbi:MAG: polysaccharide biosynthesis/export family protein [Akkermansia muciniphila]
MMMKHPPLFSSGIFRLASLAACTMLLASCVNPKEVLYIQDITGETRQDIVTKYQTTIQKDDQLYISVSSKQPELTTPFIMAEMGNSISNNAGNSRPKGYLVDDEGYIVLPVIGRMKAARKTCSQLAHDISAKLRNSDYIKDASVNVQIMNFKFSVLGEVNNPGSYQVDGQRVTIFDAISRAGDLNIDGNRDIVLIREMEHDRKIVKLDLRSKSIFSSPYYYIRQNDIIYVTPSDRKINMRSESAQYYAWGLSGLSLLIAVIAISL